MSDYKVTDVELTSIADAIRSKAGIASQLEFPSAFVSAIEAIPSGSGSVVLVSKTINSNGTYNPSDDEADAYSQVVVNVSGGGGGSDDNFLITMQAKSGVIEDSAITFIPSNVFSGNSMITGILASSVLNINQNAFKDAGLSSASFSECTYIGPYAFENCAIENIDAPKCTRIGSFAFRSCANLQSVSFPECSVFSQNTFQNCASLSIATIPEASQIIGNMFSGCGKLKELRLPVCTSIGQSAFLNCHSLESLYLLSNAVVSLANANAFTSTPMSTSSYLEHFGSIFVPESLVSAYKTAARWSTFADRITAYVEG